MMTFLRLIRKRFANKVSVDSDLWNNSHVLAISCFNCCSSVSKLPNIPGLVFFFFDKSRRIPFASLLLHFNLCTPNVMCPADQLAHLRLVGFQLRWGAFQLQSPESTHSGAASSQSSAAHLAARRSSEGALFFI